MMTDQVIVRQAGVTMIREVLTGLVILRQDMIVPEAQAPQAIHLLPQGAIVPHQEAADPQGVVVRAHLLLQEEEGNSVTYISSLISGLQGGLIRPAVFQTIEK
jgi:hypothetical protein